MNTESNENTKLYYSLLGEAKVEKQKLKNSPILCFEDFEFIKNETYPPIHFRILINSINIFNKIFDDNKKQLNDFPIGIQVIQGEEGEHLILYIFHKADILTQLVEEKNKLFDDISQSIIKKIDINLEHEKNYNEFTHVKYFNGYNYERNCINKRIKLIGDNIKILPNLYFFIDEKKSLDITKSLGLVFTKKTTEIPEKKKDITTNKKMHYGFSESDLFIEFINKIDFKELKDFIAITSYPEAKNFEPNNRYIFDIKSNSKEVNTKTMYRLNKKGKELQEALIKQNYLKKQKKICSVIILVQNYDACKTAFMNIKFQKDDIFIGFYGDVSSYIPTYIKNINITIQYDNTRNNNLIKLCLK